MKNIYYLLFLAITLFSCARKTSAQLSFTTRVLKDSLFIPWEIIYGPDDHIWFTQKNGFICRLDPVSKHLDTLYHETNTVIHNEGGMLGMALHPDFPTQPYVYVAYEYLYSTLYRERIVRYTYAGSVLNSPTILLDSIKGGNIHNGCRLLIIGDKLFLGTGETGNTAYAQDLGSINGKILRINLDGSIPTDNPIHGSPIWSWGHRNPQGLVYANSRIYSSEHGPNNDDEINIIMKGRNYGWPNVEGFCNTPAEITFCNDSNVVEPIYAWTPTLAVCGTDYYNHPMFPSLANCLIMATLKDSHLYKLQLNAAGDSLKTATIIAGINFGRLRDVCISPQGRIYISTSNSNAAGTGTFTDKIIEIYDSTFTGTPNVSSTPALLIYPNPASNYVIVELPGINTFDFNYVLINAMGGVVAKGVFTAAHNVVSVAGFPQGLYQIVVANNNGIRYTTKILLH